MREGHGFRDRAQWARHGGAKGKRCIGEEDKVWPGLEYSRSSRATHTAVTKEGANWYVPDILVSVWVTVVDYGNILGKSSTSAPNPQRTTCLWLNSNPSPARFMHRCGWGWVCA